MGWLTGWNYRKSHTIHGSIEDTGTNYQVRIKVHYGSGTDSIDDVYCSNHCKTDFGDIRFTNSDEETELSYFIEEKVDSDYAYIWIKITDSLYNLDSIIYIYYGKASGTTTSNGTDTFILFDDFEDWAAGVPVGWTVSGTWSYEAGCAKCTSSGSLVRALAHQDVAMLSRGKVSANSSNYYGLTHYLRSNFWLLCALRGSWWHHDYYTPHLQKTMHGWWYTASYQSLHSTASAFDVNTFYIFNFGMFNQPNGGGLAHIVYEFNHDSKTHTSGMYISGGGGWGIGSAGTHIGVTVFTCSPTYPAYFDWIAVRRFIYPEPTNDVWGPEEATNPCPFTVTDSTGRILGGCTDDCCPILNVRISGSKKNARRNVPKRSDGEVIDFGTSLHKPIKLEIVARVSDANKTILEEIYANHNTVTVELTSDYGTWTFLGWLEEIPSEYESSVNGDGISQPWKFTMLFIITSSSFA